MKKLTKQNIFFFILGLVISGTVAVVATNLSASNISYGNGTVATALDYLYANATSSLEYVDTIKGGKNETSSASETVLSKQLNAGKYLVIISRSSTNNNGTSENTDSETATPVLTLTGYSSINNLLYTRYGQYYRTSTNYPNQYVSVSVVTMNETNTLTASMSEKASSNIQMIIFKM